MEEFNFNQLFIWVAIAVVVLDRALNILKSRGIDLHIIAKQIDYIHKSIDTFEARTVKMADQIQDLHEWHNVSDAEGVKVWYLRRSLEEAINRLADSIELQCKVLDQMDRRLEKIQDSQEDIKQFKSSNK